MNRHGFTSSFDFIDIMLTDTYITIIDPNEEYVIDSTLFASMGKNTPFNGKTVKGRVRYTMSDGKVVYSYRPGCEIIVDKDVPKLI